MSSSDVQIARQSDFPAARAPSPRALLCGRGDGIAIDRGMEYLANLQKDEGIWPAQPLRRMPADAHVSAFILSQLGDHPTFAESVRLSDALDWFAGHEDEVDAET